MRRRAMVGIAILLMTLSGLAYQARVQGQVRGRNGAGLPGCQLDFFLGGAQEPTYRVYTNQGGVFFLNNPRNGNYSVIVNQGRRSFRLTVSISGSTLKPSVLNVPW